MKLEVTVEGQEPVVYKLKKDKTLLGAGGDSDIVINADGISRKHLMIVAENDQYFVVDQGSTNGSYINEERLTPGDRNSFTSFFPVKMGFYVTIALLSDDEGAESFDFAKSLPKTQEVKSKGSGTKTDVVAPRNATSTKIQLEKPKDKKPDRKGRARDNEKESGDNSLKVVAIFIAVFGTAALWYFTRSEEEVPVAPVQQVVITAPQVDLRSFEFNLPELEASSSILSSVTDQKCTQAGEADFCRDLVLPHPNYNMTGVVFTPASVAIVLPLISSDEAFEVFKPAFAWNDQMKEKVQVTDPRDLITLFLSRLNGATLSQVTEEQRWLYVIFVNSTGQRQGIVWVADLKQLKPLLTPPEHIMVVRQARSDGLAPISYLGGFFRNSGL